MNTNHQIESARQQIQNEFNRWLEFWAEKIMPPVVFRWSKEGRHTPFIIRYCQRHGIKLVYTTHFIELHHQNQKVATFAIQFTK